MKLALGSWAFAFGPFAQEPWSFAKVLEYAADAGYDGIEISGFRPHPHPDDYDTPQKCRELLKSIQGMGLGISGYAPDLTRVPPAEVTTTVYLHEIHKCLDFCASCGIETLRVDTASPPDSWRGVAFDKRFSRLVETWRAAAQAASSAGVLIVWEFEPGFWLNKPSEVKHVVEAVGHGNFKLLFDTSHAYMSAVMGARHGQQKETLAGGVAEYGRLLREYIGHLHLIDSDGTLHGDETSTHSPFGKGQIEFVTALAPIRTVIDRLPWWCVDLCFNLEAAEAGRDAVSFVHRLMETAE